MRFTNPMISNGDPALLAPYSSSHELPRYLRPHPGTTHAGPASARGA
jgi:hypothetical protein